jgi:hypothetical protein
MMDHADLISHEAGHAVGLLVNGHGVAEVRVDHERVGELGRVTADFSNSSADLGIVIAAAMGPLAEGDPPPSWPPDPDSIERDERNLAILVEYLELDESDYKAAIAIAAHLLDDPDVKAAHALLCQALHRVPVITGEQLRELLGPHLARLQPEEVDRAAA